MKIQEQIQDRLNDFSTLCQLHRVEKLYAFGSSVTENFNPQTSDIDLLVEIDEKDPLERGEKLMSLWDKLEGFFQRKVDLLTANSIRNKVLQANIDRTKILIYDGKGKKIPG